MKGEVWRAMMLSLITLQWINIVREHKGRGGLQRTHIFTPSLLSHAGDAKLKLTSLTLNPVIVATTGTFSPPLPHVVAAQTSYRARKQADSSSLQLLLLLNTTTTTTQSAGFSTTPFPNTLHHTTWLLVPYPRTSSPRLLRSLTAVASPHVTTENHSPMW